MRLFFLSLILLFLTAVPLAAQTANQKTLRDLLDFPAPPPASEEAATIKEYPPQFYDKKTPPPDDAPIEDLLAYWAHQNSLSTNMAYNIKPSETVAQRLLEAVEAKPEVITEYLKVLPANAALVDLVQRLAAEKSEPEDLDETGEDYQREELKNWLKFNSREGSSALVKKAQDIRDDKDYVTNQDELLALGRVDWDTARPIAERLYADKSQPASSTLAAWVLYQHALDADDASEAERLRDELKRIVEDKTAAPGKRDLAMDALTQTADWDGRADWYLTLLEDETLYDMRAGGRTFTGLTTLIRVSPPDVWIPKLIPLVSSSNRVVRRAAVRNLIEYLDESHKEVVEALLPWLSNPKWIDDARASGADGQMMTQMSGSETANGRRRLIEAVGATDVPASVPGLIQIVMNEDDSNLRSSAAQALVRYKSPQAIPALNFALSKERLEGYRTNIIAALIASGGIADEAQMAALESYATAISTPEGLENIQKMSNYESETPLPVQMSVGKFLSDTTEPSDGLATRAIARLKVLRRTNPPVAQTLADIMQKWQGRVVFLEMIRRIADGTADADTILSAIAKRKAMREKSLTDLTLIRGKAGLPRGAAAIILDDRAEMSSILSQTDAEAAAALLAGARLVRAALPVADVAPLLKSPNALLALAAERYLESEDSAAARTLVLARHAGEAKILGARNSFAPDDKKTAYSQTLADLFESAGAVYFGEEDFSLFKTAEEKLRKETKENADLKLVFALLPDAESGQEIIRVFKDRITYTYYEDAARYRERVLDPKEYEAFLRFLLDRKIDQLSGLGSPCEECSTGEFVMFSASGGRRVFYRSYGEMNSPITDLEKRFAEIRKGESHLHYLLADKIKGLEVILADDKYTARAVWKNAGDFRVLVEDTAKQEQIERELTERDKADNLDEIDAEDYARRQEIWAAQRKRREDAQFAHWAWRKIENGKLGAETEKPADWNYSLERLSAGGGGSGYAGEYEGDYYTPNAGANTVRVGDYEVFAGYLEQRGLWKFVAGQEPTLIKGGWFGRPMASADGKWLVASKFDETQTQPPSVVRINLQTGKEFKINLAPAAQFFPLAFLPAQNKFLLYRGKSDSEYPQYKNDTSPAATEYYLLDAGSGAAQIIKGEFRPLAQTGYRPMQPIAGAPNEFWAAIYDEKTRATAIGKYDARLFAFKSVLQIPDIELSSADITVDAQDGKVYFIYQGHLLALPLPKQP